MGARATLLLADQPDDEGDAMPREHALSVSDVEIVRGVYAAFARRDLEFIRAALHPDFVMEQSDLLPWGGRRHGVDGFFAFLGTLLSHVAPTVETEALFDAGDHVVQVGFTHGTVLAHGTPFRLREMHAWQLRDGLITSYRIYVDVPAMVAALDGAPTAPNPDH
ncbi:nuclear transport factor 2 family protein [Actinomycetes bacterium KLBMP 9759]